MTGVFIKEMRATSVYKGTEETQEKGHVKMEAKIGMM